MSIVIIRHGETDLNGQDKIRGWLDVPLDQNGKQQAQKTAKKIKNESMDLMVSSDLKRAKETADIISKETKVPIKEVSKDFRPWDVGKLAGTDSKEAHKILAVHAQEHPNEPVDGGESFNNFKDRFLKGIEKIKKKYSDKVIGVVTHHRGDKIMAAWEKKGMPKSLEIDMPTFLTEGIKPGDYRVQGEIKHEQKQEADYKPIKKPVKQVLEGAKAEKKSILHKVLSKNK